MPEYFQTDDAYVVQPPNADELHAAGLTTHTGTFHAVRLGSGDVVVFTGNYVVLREVPKCQHCGLVGGH